jgi:hypothetical protein
MASRRAGRRRRAQEAGLHAVVAVGGDGRVLALANETAVISVPEHRRPWVPVSSVSRSLEPGLVLAPHLGGEDLLAALRATPSTEYLVESAPGRFAVLVAADVAHAVAAPRS